MNKFWAPINSDATAHVDLEALGARLLMGIFGAYLMEEPRTVHDLFTFTISKSGGIEGTHPRFSPDNAKLMLKWCVMVGQVNNQGNLLLVMKIESTLSVCRNFGCWKKMRLDVTLGQEQEKNK